MKSVEDEVNKYRNSKDRAELERLINDYKNLALQNANNLAVASQYSMVAAKLKEICDRLPAPKLVNYPTGRTRGDKAKTVDITSEEQARIDADWRKRTKNKGY